MGEIDYNEYRSQLPSMYGRSRSGSRSGSRGGGRRGARRRAIAPRRMIRTRPMPPRPEVPEPDPVDTVPIGEPGNVLWSKRLSRSDVGITPEGGTTHVTSNLKLGSGGRLRDGRYVSYRGDCPFDRNTYFVEEVFSGLEWENTAVTSQTEATTQFRIFVQGEYYGEYEIRISHDMNRAYHEGASAEPPTWLHAAAQLRQSFSDEAFVGGYVELCGEAGSEGPFELHFYSNLQA